MNKQNKKLDDVLRKALELLEAGKSPEEILKLFPKNQKTIKEIIAIFSVLNKQKESIKPSPEFFSRLINRLPSGVTDSQPSRYLYRGAEIVKGRPSLTSLISQIHNLMALKLKIMVPAILAIFVLAIVYFQFGAKTSQQEQEQGPAGGNDAINQQGVSNQQVSLALPPAATGNIDDVIAAFLGDSSGDSELFQSEAGDATLINSDSQAISDFGQYYDETDI